MITMAIYVNSILVIVFVFFLLDRGHEAKNLQSHFPTEDFSESLFYYRPSYDNHLQWLEPQSMELKKDLCDSITKILTLKTG